MNSEIIEARKKMYGNLSGESKSGTLKEPLLEDYVQKVVVDENVVDEKNPNYLALIEKNSPRSADQSLSGLERGFQEFCGNTLNLILMTCALCIVIIVLVLLICYK